MLSGGRNGNLNIEGAYLEVLSDAIASLGVIIGAGMIYLTGWVRIDPLIAAAIALWVIPRTWVLLRESLHVLLEGVPNELDLSQIRHSILATPGVLDIHDLHLWSLTSGRNLMSAHVVHESSHPAASLTTSLNAMLVERYSLAHTTLQLETTSCGLLNCADARPEHHEHDHGQHGHDH